MPVTINGSAGVTTNSGAVYNSISSGTAVTASGTSVDFTSIPSWVKRITVMFSGVSTSGTSHKLVQLGTSGGVVTTGYSSTLGAGSQASAVNTVSSTAGIPIFTSAASDTATGSLIITNISSNTWVAQGVINNTTATILFCATSGSVALGGTLDRIRITTVNGTDTFDAGSINILYE
jgi:hypothetical protein